MSGGLLNTTPWLSQGVSALAFAPGNKQDVFTSVSTLSPTRRQRLRIAGLWKCEEAMGPSSSGTEYANGEYQYASGEERRQRDGGDAWFYVRGDAKRGPISALQIKDLLNRGEIGTETAVWREGMREWQPLRESALGGLVAKEPPPVSNKLVRNGLVWMVAMLPLLYACIDAGIAQENQAAAARTIVLGMPFQRTGQMPWVIPSVINAALCLWDNRRLKRAGYQNKWMLATAFALAPVYLLIRARVLKQKPTYAIAWLVTTVVGILITS